MQSFLIIGKPISKALTFALEFCQKEKIDKLDVTLIESEKAVGIAKVRDFQKKIYLKPFKSDKKAVILNTEFGITVESQNALLKVLEEPPKNTIIMVLAKSGEEMLPTIVSRCKLILLDYKEDLEQKNTEDFEKLLLSLKEMGVGDKLKLAEGYSKDKETALQFIEGLLTASESLLKNGRFEFLNSAKKLQIAYTEIKSTNANLRLAVENLFLNLFS